LALVDYESGAQRRREKVEDLRIARNEVVVDGKIRRREPWKVGLMACLI
jgi:ribosomal protein S4E